jgi:hypothetical protein
MKLHAKSVGAICVYCGIWEDCNKVIYNLYICIGLPLKPETNGYICFTKKKSRPHIPMYTVII